MEIGKKDEAVTRQWWRNDDAGSQRADAVLPITVETWEGVADRMRLEGGSSSPVSEVVAWSSRRRPTRTPGAPSASLSRVQTRADVSVGWLARQCCRGVERIRAGGRAAAFFPLAASYRFCRDQGPVGRKWSLPWPEARREACAGPWRKGGKGRREVLEKRRGTSASLYLTKGRAGRWGRLRRHAGRGGRWGGPRGR